MMHLLRRAHCGLYLDLIFRAMPVSSCSSYVALHCLEHMKAGRYELSISRWRLGKLATIMLSRGMARLELWANVNAVRLQSIS